MRYKVGTIVGNNWTNPPEPKAEIIKIEGDLLTLKRVDEVHGVGTGYVHVVSKKDLQQFFKWNILGTNNESDYMGMFL